jgi:ABC-type polysaccharide/polyol phosphate export permease
MALMLDLFHTVLYLGEMPNLRNLLLMLIEAITFVSLGYLVFNRKKREFAEII